MGNSNLAIRIGNALPVSVTETIGSSSTLKRLTRPLVNSIMPNALARVTIKSGAAASLQMEIDPKQEKFYWTGLYEPKIQEVLTTILHPGDAFWDVGAHVGFFTLLAAKLVGTAGEIHAFEPNASNRTRLERNLELNGFLNVTIHDSAVSDALGSSSFLFHESSSMGRLGSKDDMSIISVNTTTLDHQLEENRLPKLIKIDAEGAEEKILRGATGMLRRGKTAWLIEVHDPTDSAAILKHCASYSVIHLDLNHVLAMPRTIDEPPVAGF